LEHLDQELERVQESIANLKKERASAMKTEKTLKEELAHEVDQKEALEEKVKDHVRDKVDKDSTMEKTFKSI
jgi:phage shock protein A